MLILLKNHLLKISSFIFSISLLFATIQYPENEKTATHLLPCGHFNCCLHTTILPAKGYKPWFGKQ